VIGADIVLLVPEVLKLLSCALAPFPSKFKTPLPVPAAIVKLFDPLVSPMSNRPIVFVASPASPVLKRLIVWVAVMLLPTKTNRPAASGPPTGAVGVQFVFRLHVWP